MDSINSKAACTVDIRDLKPYWQFDNISFEIKYCSSRKLNNFLVPCKIVIEVKLVDN